MRATLKLAVAPLLVLSAAACDDQLQVKNLTSPDVDRVFATPAAIEQTLGTGMQSCHNAIVRNDKLMAQLLSLSLESYSQLNNFEMGVRSAIPRTPIQNTQGSPTIFTDFSALSRGARLASNAITALQKLTTGGGTLGTAAQDLRAKAFGYLAMGCQQGYLAMVYDSGGIVTVGMPSAEIPELSAASELMKEAIKNLDSAVTVAGQAAATGSGGFPTPEAWLGGKAFSRDEFVRLARSYRARFRAGVARTKAQRDAVDWAAVVADAEAGIQADYTPNSGGSTGWSIGFIGSQMHVDAGTWSVMSMMYYGMADVSGAYDAWLATPLSQRSPFLVITPDKRWPQGATRAAQQTNSPQPTGLTSRPYVSNRSVQDTPGEPWGWSFYDFFRMKYIRNASSTGVFPEFMKAENDLLAAEGYIRLGDFAKAAAKIDLSRVSRGELPALTGVVTNGTMPVPGGASCVPRYPVGPNFTSTACGNIWEAMKWEKRMETAFTGYGNWWFDSRGWGDLVENTTLEYPVPFQEMDARQRGSYNLGGGGASSAPKGTYGF
jgi:hypothetical protein